MAALSSKPTVWKKRILIPFWVVRICIMLFIIVLSAIALVAIKDNPNLTMPAIGVIVLFMLLIVIVLLMDVMAILMFLRDGLNATKFLIMNVIQTSFWAAVLLLDLAAIARSGTNGAAIGFSVLVLCTFVGLLIYASIVYHKERKQRRRGQYAPTNNPGVPPFLHDPSAYSVPGYQNTQAVH